MQKEKKELEEKRAKYPNHPMFRKKESKVSVLEKLDELLEEVDEKQEEKIDSNPIHVVGADISPAPFIKKQVFIKKREHIDAKVPAISMVQGGNNAVAKGKMEFVKNQKSKGRMTTMIN